VWSQTDAKSTLRITLHITPKRKSDPPQRASRKKRHNRPSQRQRLTIARKLKAEKEGQPGTSGLEAQSDEEDMMNAMTGTRGGMDEFEEEEEVEVN
jgi:hypothetical protein